MPPQTARMGGHRSGGVSPVPPPLRPNYLSGEVPSVEPGGAPLVLTPRGATLAGFIAALVFCVGVWLAVFMLGVIPAAAGVIFGAVTFVVIANVTHAVSQHK